MGRLQQVVRTGRSVRASYRDKLLPFLLREILAASFVPLTYPCRSPFITV